jgi:hypothetical protein
VLDSVGDVRNLGLSNGRPAVFAVIFRQLGANTPTRKNPKPAVTTKPIAKAGDGYRQNKAN